MNKEPFKVHRHLAYSIEHFYANKLYYLSFYFKLFFISLFTFIIFNFLFGYLCNIFFPGIIELLSNIKNLDFSTPSNLKTSLDKQEININLNYQHLIIALSYIVLFIILTIPLYVINSKFVLSSICKHKGKTSILKSLFTYSFTKRVGIILLFILYLVLLFGLNLGIYLLGISSLMSEQKFLYFLMTVNAGFITVISISIFLLWYCLADHRLGFIKCIQLSLSNAITKLFVILRMLLVYFAYTIVVGIVFFLSFGLLVVIPVEIYTSLLNKIYLDSSNINLLVNISFGVWALVYFLVCCSVLNIYFARFHIITNR